MHAETTSRNSSQPFSLNSIAEQVGRLPFVPAPMIGFSLALYLAVYAFLIVAYMGVITHLAWKATKSGKPGADKPVEAGTFAAAE